MSKSYTYKQVRFSPVFVGRSRAVVIDSGICCHVVTVSGFPMWWMATTKGFWYVGDVTVSGSARHHVSDVENVVNC